MFSFFPQLVMLSVVLAVALFNSVEIDPEREFQICVEKCTSPNSIKRVQCKLSCSEEMKENYEQQFNEDSEKLKKEKGEEKEKEKHNFNSFSAYFQW